MKVNHKKRKRRKLAHKAGFDHYWEYKEFIKHVIYRKCVMTKLANDCIDATAVFVPREFLVVNQLAIYSMLKREKVLTAADTKEFNKSIKKLAKSLGVNLNRTGDHYELEEKKTTTENRQEA